MAAFSREQLTAFVRGISAPASSPCQRPGAVRLSAQPFSQSRARQRLDGGAGERRLLHTLFWQFLPITILFYTACLVHTALGIWALYERRQFRWKAIEPLQLVLGLSVPALVIAHIIGVRLGQTLYGHEKLYPQVLFVYWMWEPYRDLDDARGHDRRLGPRLHRTLFLAPHARRSTSAPRRILLAAAVLIPTLCDAGFLSGRPHGHRKRQRRMARGKP